MSPMTPQPSPEPRPDSVGHRGFRDPTALPQRGRLAGAPGEVIDLGSIVEDLEGAGRTFRWSQVGGPSIGIGDAKSANPSIIIPAEGKGLLVFQVVVTDGERELLREAKVQIQSRAEADRSISPEREGTRDFGTGGSMNDTVAFETSELDLSELRVYEATAISGIELDDAPPTSVATAETTGLAASLPTPSIPTGPALDVGNLSFQDIFVEETTVAFTPELPALEPEPGPPPARNPDGKTDAREGTERGGKAAWLWGLLRGAGSKKSGLPSRDRDPN